MAALVVLVGSSSIIDCVARHRPRRTLPIIPLTQGDVQPLQRSRLKCLHFLGFFLRFMIIAKEMQGAMNDKMGKMVLGGDALLGRLAANDAGGENDVAERRHLPLGQAGDRAGGKGQHIGGAGLAAMALVEIGRFRRRS